MKIKDDETYKERQERLSLVDNAQRDILMKQLPILLLILAVSIMIFVIINIKKSSEPIGNPYECMDCKTYGRACKRHKNFDADKDLIDKITQCVINYNIYKSEDIDKYVYYIYGESKYNLDCDFCKENRKECAGCKYTRTSITAYITEVISKDDTFSKMCDTCNELGYPSCNADIKYVVDETYKLLKQQ